MTAIEQQDEAAKTRIRLDKALLAGLGVGLIFFFVSGGIPWFSAVLPDAAMGRPLFSEVPDQGMIVRILGIHFLLAMVYGLVIALAVFPLGPWAAVWTGGLVGLGLWALNLIVFRFLMGYPAVNEAPIAITHLVFGMVMAGAYKALSVPRRTASGRFLPPAAP